MRAAQEMKSETHSGELDFRCECGGLMAKIIPAGIEIKCRRCKRIHCIPFENVQRDVEIKDAE